MKNLYHGRSSHADLAVTCSFVCYWGLVLSRFFDVMSLELIFAASACAIVFVALGYQCLASSQRIMFSSIDVCVALIWATELVAYTTSTYRRNSFSAILDLAILTTVYALFRLLIACRPGLRWSLLVFGILGAALAFVQAKIASQWFNSAFEAGFTDMSSLKALCPILITPLPNDWATILLLLMPFTLLMSIIPAKKLVRSVLLVTSIACNAALVSSLLLVLSRGALVGFIAFWVAVLIAAIVFHVNLKQVLLSFAVSFAIAIITVSAAVPSIRGEIQQMAMGKQSISQARSTEGRLSNWKSAWTIARSHPLIGVGQENFAIQLVPYVGKSSERTFGGQTFNTPLQLFAERGLVGVISFSLLLMFLLWSEYRFLSNSEDNIERCTSVIFISAIAAVVVRELTYSSLLSSPQASLLMWALMASTATRSVAVRPTAAMKPRLYAPVKRIAGYAFGVTVMVLLAGAIVVFYVASNYAQASSSASDAARYLMQRQNEKVLQSIGLAIKNDPENAYYISTQGLEQGRLSLPVMQNSSTGNININTSGLKPRLLSASIVSYRKAMDIIPQDDNFANNMGWLYYYAGDVKSAEDYIRRAITINSGEYAYHVGLAFLMGAQQQESAANDEYSTAMLLNPSFIDSPVFRSLEQKQPTRASKIITNSVSMLKSEAMQTSSPIVKARLGALLLKSGHGREAISYLRDATSSLPSLPLAWRNLGNALRDIGSYQDA
ncbi:MAG: O-antigen ligase family protein, partial [Terracidiphilus sp.]